MTDSLTELLDTTDWSSVDPVQDLPAVITALHDLEGDQGVTDLHRAFSEALLPHVPARVQHSRVHRNSLTAVAMSPCGRFLATGSQPPNKRHADGGEIAIWDVESGRVVNAIYEIPDGVGAGDTKGCLQWAQDGSLLAAAYSTNTVGTFDPFDDRGGPLMCADLTDRWRRPPAFALSPDGSRICIACSGPTDGLPGATLPAQPGAELGPDHPDVQWFPPGDEGVEPWIEFVWDAGRIYGLNEEHSQAWSVDDETLAPQYLTTVHAPATYSPDGQWIAHNPAGLAIYDGQSGRATTRLPMIVGGTEMVWSPVAEQRRVALIVGPRNPFRVDPGVHIFDDGKLIATVHDEPIWNTSKLRDAPQFAFSDDGVRCALITAEDTAAIWTVEDGGSHLKNLAITPAPPGCCGATEGSLPSAKSRSSFSTWSPASLGASMTSSPLPGFSNPCPALLPGSTRSPAIGPTSPSPTPQVGVG